jgi:hypothetical protein
MTNTPKLNLSVDEKYPLIDDLLLNVNDSASTTENYIIHTKRLNQSMVLFTLYGTKIEEFLAQLLHIRAIDQKGIADQITKNIFSTLFKPETDPQFNTFIQQSQEAYLDKIIELCQSEKDKQKIKAKMEKNPAEFFHFEIDGTVLLNYLIPLNPNLNRKTQKKNQNKQRKYIEIKLFTMPEGDKTKSIRPHFQKGFLTRNFTINNYLGLIGFSFLHKKGEDSPLSIDFETGAYPDGIQSVWAVHLIMIDKTILKAGLNAPAIARLVLSGMQDHDQILLKEIDSQLDLNFRPTSNLVKVILMAQIIHQLKQQVEYERKQKEAERKQKEAERKQKEAERKQKEAERKQKEAERKRAEQYKELLKKHNISFE